MADYPLNCTWEEVEHSALNPNVFIKMSVYQDPDIGEITISDKSGSEIYALLQENPNTQLVFVDLDGRQCLMTAAPSTPTSEIKFSVLVADTLYIYRIPGGVRRVYTDTVNISGGEGAFVVNFTLTAADQTYSDIMSAAADGKVVIGRYSSNTYYFTGDPDGDEAIFVRLHLNANTQVLQQITLAVDESVSITARQLYVKPSGGIPSTDLNPTVLAGFVPKSAQADASLMTNMSLIPVGIDSNDALQAASGFVITLSQSGQTVLADLTPAIIYTILATIPTMPFTLIDLSGRRCGLVAPPVTDGGTASFATYDASNDAIVIYTIAGNSTVTSRTVSMGGGGSVTAAAVVDAIEDMTAIQKGDARDGLDAAQTPMIVEFSEQGGIYSASESLADIEAALAAGRIVSGFNEAGADCRVIGQDVGEVQFAAIDDSNGGSSLTVRVYTVYQNSVGYATEVFQWASRSVNVSGTTPSITADDNTIYNCGTLTSLTIVDASKSISFTVDFTSGSTPTAIAVPSGYKAPGGDLTAEANKTYELNVRNGKAVLSAFEAVSASA